MTARRIITLAACMVIALFMVASSCQKKPTTPIKPLGNAQSYNYSTETYRTVSTDPGKNQIKYVFDWGDGTVDTTDLFGGDPANPDTASALHTWLAEGSRVVKAMAINAKGAKSGWSDGLTVTVGANSKPNAPAAIQGVNGGILNQYIIFTTTSTDPDGDSIYIKFVYDTTQPSRNSGWIAPAVAGGTYVSDSAKYATAGTYYVVAYAMDTKGAISDPSPAFQVVIAPIEIGWEFNTVDGDAFLSSPAIDASTGGDTIVYCGCEDGNIYAFNARTGASKGSYGSLNGDGFSSSPAISADGQRVYAADAGGWLYCLSAAGLSKLSYYPDTSVWVPGMQPFFSTPAVYNTAVYVGRDDGYIYRFDDIAGTLTYHSSYNTFADISPSPAISSDGSRIVVGNDSGYVYCFDDTLSLIWKVYSGAPISSSPAISGNTVYYGSDDAILHAVSLTDGSNVGAQFTASDFITSSPIVDAAGNVYFCVDNGTVYCIHNGALVWDNVLPYGENTSATCCLAPDTTLIINTDDGSVYALDLATGVARYRIEWPEPVFAKHGRNPNHSRARVYGKTADLSSSATVGPKNGLFYAGSPNEGFYAVKVDKPVWTDPTNGGLPTAPWPKFHHDIENSGLVGRTK